MAIGWYASLADAKTDYTTNRFITTAWDNCNDAQKTKALYNAYERLYYDKNYSLPTYAAATAVQKVRLQKAQREMTYYIIVHLNDEDKRKGIQAQGTISAGIVSENYDKDMLTEIPIPATVKNILDDFKKSKYGIAVNNLEREERDSVDNDDVYDDLD